MKDPIKALLLALGLAGTWFWLQGDLLLNLADEGFLWYGTWRTTLGDIPLRDFQSYDPGRYYWVSACSILTGTGVLGLRMAVSLFQVIGLTFGILALRRVIRSWWGLGLAGILLLVWMYPWHKVFEHSLAMAAIFFALILLERPSLGRHFAAGMYVGLAAFFGRNHGLYCLLAYLALILIIHLKERKGGLPGRLVLFGAGIWAGYAPMLILIATSPGFFSAFLQSILSLFRLKTTNLPLPVPWPWSINFSGMDAIQTARAFSTGVFYVLVPVFYGIIGIYMLISKRGWQSRKKNIMIASVIVGTVYFHHSFSRAGLSHLAQGIHPFLMGVISLPFMLRWTMARLAGWAILLLVVLLTLFSVLIVNPCYLKAVASEGVFTEFITNGDRLIIYNSTANLISSLAQVNSQVEYGPKILVAPHWPGFYPLFKRIAPLREIYFLFSKSEAQQKEQINRFEEKGVKWVLLGDVALDGREELRFRNTHPLLFRHIMENFRQISMQGLPHNYQVMKRVRNPHPYMRDQNK